MGEANTGENTEENTVGHVVGRWELGPGHPLDRHSTLHPARLIGGDDGDERLVEIHRLVDGLDPTETVAALRQASRISDPGLLTVVDVGAAVLDNQPVLYVATARWFRTLDDTTRSEPELLALAQSLASGLATLHRAELIHGALHRGGVRWSGSAWQLAPAGLAPVLQTEVAPYRPAGLQVVEPIAAPADLWSLGVILHQQATGRLLRPGEQPRLGGMPVLEPIVATLLEPAPADRPTANDVTQRLARSADGASIGHTAAVGPPPVRPDSVPGSTHGGPSAPEPSGVSAQASSRRPGRLIAGAAAALALVIGAIALILFMPPGNEAGNAQSVETEGDDSEVASPTSSSAPADDGGDTTADTEPEEVQGPIGLGDLAIGDCVEVDLSLGDPTMAERVPCDSDHNGEIVGLVDHLGAADGAYPGRALLLEEARPACDAEFEAVVGGPALFTSLITLAAVPTFGEWDRGQRQSTICLAHRFDNAPLVAGLTGRFASHQLTEGSAAPLSKMFGARCFDSDSSIDTIGRRQVVSLVGCENLHRHETLSVETLPLEAEESNSDILTPEINTKLTNEAFEVCQGIWDEFSVAEGAPEPTINAIVPDVVDWQVGDRLMTCTASWDEPVVGSVVILNLPPPGQDDENEDGG